ncbi:sugar transferase [Streptomyces sp. NBC_00138]
MGGSGTRAHVTGPAAVGAVAAPRGAGSGGTGPAGGPADVAAPRGGGRGWGVVGADVGGGVAGLALAEPRGGVVLAGALLGVLLLAHRAAGPHRPAPAPSALAELPLLVSRTVLVWGLAAAAVAATAPGDALGWSDLLGAVALTALTTVALRALAYRLRRPTAALIVGSGPAARRITAVLRAHPEYGLRPAAGPDAARCALVAGPAAALDARSAATVRALAARGCPVWEVGAEGAPVSGPHHLWGYACRPLPGEPYPAAPAARRAKRALDAVVAATALLALAPVLAACALAVRLADGPGVIFRQERVGLGGRPFTLLKFRTLRPGDVHEAATLWSIAHDKRMSAAGRLLRRTSLDELPQLWNVLRGDMSLVGPRPERPHFVEQFSDVHPGYRDRHRMPAGITGLAQVHGLRGDTSIADRARFDNHYIDTWTLSQDIAILLRTALALFRLGGS